MLAETQLAFVKLKVYSTSHVSSECIDSFYITVASIKLCRLPNAYLDMMASQINSRIMKCLSRIRYVGLHNFCYNVHHFKTYDKDTL